ncbi:MAG: hypothetical protein ACXVGB_09940 [Mycobacteriaceae bacterium]
MKRLAFAALSAAAALGLTACSHSAAPVVAGHSSQPVVRHTLASCSQQYSTWQQGAGKGLLAALHTVSVAGTAADPHVLSATLKSAEPAVTRAIRHPVPACVDPRGYWSVLLMHLNAAAANPNSTASVRAAMKNVPQIDHALAVEIKHISR